MNSPIVDSQGNKFWIKTNDFLGEVYTQTYGLHNELGCVSFVLHREDGPALIKADGSEKWYLNGIIHRVGGPASKEYYTNFITEEWRINGILHREDGPAHIQNGITSPDVYVKYWYLNGKMHRLDGPASECSFSGDSWYYNGTYIDCSSQKEFEKLIKLKAFW